MSQNDPKRIWMAGLKRQRCFGAGGVLLDRFAEATVIEKLERGAAEVECLNACRKVSHDIIDASADAEGRDFRRRRANPNLNGSR